MYNEASPYLEVRRWEGDASALSFMHYPDDEGREPTARGRSNRTIRRAIPSLAALLLSLVALTASFVSVPTVGQEPLRIGIDANVAGNGPVSLSTIDRCVSVNRGDVFDVDIYIQNVNELVAWLVYIQYDPSVLEIADRDVEMFLAGNPGSAVVDASSRGLPPGLYAPGAADVSDPPTPDSGSGVLLRLSLKALSAGTSDIELIVRDIDGDGLADQGPLLRNVDADVLGDIDGDTIFDGPIENAEVAVDAACEDPIPTATPANPSEGGNGAGPALIAIAAAGGAIILAIAGLIAFRLARRPRATPE
jgi:hypothetical protein